MKEEITSRRELLRRGALLAGCGLWMPIIFSGCDAKKGGEAMSNPPANPPATPSATPSASNTSPAAPVAPVKVAQADVKYQLQPKGEQKCSSCQNFIAESNTCKLVAGQISPDGWCTLWVKRA